jgi:GntP family gluconate:H+ symporter
MTPIFAAIGPPNYWPFAILAISVAFVVVAITRLRLHAFIALVMASFLAGFLTTSFKPELINRLPAALRADATENSWVAAVELTALEFGGAAGGIAISIGLAALIGLGLMESGAADKVVRRFLATFGEKRAALALLVSTYILSIPIFFDTMFMLMVPLAKAMGLRMGKDYLLYVMVICCGAILTHSLTVPHPGPLAMVDNLRVDPGQSLFWGIAAGIVPCAFGYFIASWINRRNDVPLRETAGATLEDLRKISLKPENELPSFFLSIIPVILPIALIGLASFAKILAGYPGAIALAGGPDTFASLARIASFIGNKNIALAIGAVLALWVLAGQRKFSFAQIERLIDGPLATAAIIILITAAGGAFGGMLRNAGVGDAIKELAQSYNLNRLVLAWLTAILLRVAQGSATVSMITTSAIIWPMIDPTANVLLPFHTMYVFLAIGFGAFGGSWMNDSGFWVVSKLGGLTEKETVKSWSLMVTLVSGVGLIFTLALSRLLPLAPI